MTRSPSQRIAQLIALCGALLALLLQFTPAMQRLEWITFDQRLEWLRAEAPLHPEVAVVLIDEASLQALDPLVGRWPWPRSLYGDLLEFLAMGGARAVVFDLLFTERELGAGDGDLRLLEASAATGIAYHAFQLQKEAPDERFDGHGTAELNHPLPEGFAELHAIGPARLNDEHGNNAYLMPVGELYHAARGMGWVGLGPDEDGVYRHARLFDSYQGSLLPSLSLAPLLGEHELSVESERVLFDGHEVPLDGRGRYLVNLTGPGEPYSIGGIFASIQRLQRGEVDELLIYPDEFADKIVFVGASAAGLEDVKATPLSAKTPGVMVHAAVASNLLSGEFLRPTSSELDTLIIVTLALLTGYSVILGRRLALQLLLPLLLIGLYLGFNLQRFSQLEVYPLIGPLTAVGFTWLSALAWLAFTEGRDKHRVRNMFSRYLSPAVLSEVMDDYEAQLGAGVGKREELTILFSDVRGFTGISESLEAEQVVELLNTHFSVMSEIIFQRQGTLDKFIGDAIMAFWGAPIRVEDHARRAVQAALEMSRGVDEVNQQLAQKGLPPVRIGIGLNSGDVVLGNIGSERKLDYTVIGDSVNLASRLEGLTSHYGCPVLISEFTRAELGSEQPCAMVDLVRVKGKQVPIRIYQPLALEQANGGRLQALSEEAFALYLQRRWPEALSRYQQLAEAEPTHATLAEIFSERCRRYMESEPAADWDGVYTLTSK